MKSELFNKEIALTSTPYDVAGKKKTWRIIYFEDERKIIVVSSMFIAQRYIDKHHDRYRCESLTPSQAARRYPTVFTNSSKQEFQGSMRTIMLKVPSEMYLHCCRKEKISTYLRTLIAKEMEKEKYLL